MTYEEMFKESGGIQFKAKDYFQMTYCPLDLFLTEKQLNTNINNTENAQDEQKTESPETKDIE